MWQNSATRFAALVVLTFEVHAAQISTIVTARPEPATVKIEARRVDGKADPIERTLAVPGETALPLPPGIWEIQLVNEGLWAAPVYLRDSDSAAMRVWPAVPLRGTANGITELRVQFTPADPEGASGEVNCAVHKSDWTCSIPSGKYDLRFSSRGSAPELRFGVPVPAERGIPLRFVAGASLTGHLEAVRGLNVSLETAQVSLTGENSRYTAKASANGFFQFKGLAPGDYVLRAEKQPLMALSRSIVVVAGAAAELREPLLLDRPKRFAVTISPALGPDLKPWRVSLSSLSADRQKDTAITDSTADVEGQWSYTKAIAGDYRLAIQTTSGDLWHWQDVIVADTDVNVPITLIPEKISGTITLGDRPIAASLSFGGQQRPTLRSDEDGRFEGVIPPPGKEVLEVFVECETPRIWRAVAVKFERHMTIKLPHTTLTGRVVHEDGSPAPEAIVTINGNERLAFTQALPENDGRFQIEGMEPGNYLISAEGSKSRTVSTPISLADNAPAEIELVLRRHVGVAGRMTMGSIPIVHADIHAIPRDVQWVPLMPRAKTTEVGRFALQLPPGTTAFDVIAVHPAFDIVLGRATVRPKKILNVYTNQIGGTLTVDSTPPVKDLLLRHEGGECWLTWLAGKAGGNVASERVVVPRLEPGEYSVCLANSSKCASGYLPPHGALTLAID